MQCRPEICKSPHRQPTRTLTEDLFIHRRYNTRTIAPLDDELVELVTTPTMLCRFVVVQVTGLGGSWCYLICNKSWSIAFRTRHLNPCNMTFLGVSTRSQSLDYQLWLEFPHRKLDCRSRTLSLLSQSEWAQRLSAMAWVHLCYVGSNNPDVYWSYRSGGSTGNTIKGSRIP